MIYSCCITIIYTLMLCNKYVILQIFVLNANIFFRTEHNYISTNFSISNNNSAEDNFTRYFYGDLVGFSCNPGFKFQGNSDLIQEFKLECSSNGSWIGSVPNCVPLQCSWPESLKNGKFFLHLNNKTVIEIAEKNSSIFSLNSKEISIIEDISQLFTPGVQISSECEKGFKNIGDNFRICTYNETWTNKDTFCKIQNCSLENHLIIELFEQYKEEIKLESDSKIEDWKKESNLKANFGFLEFFFEGIFYGDKITFSCQNGTAFTDTDFQISEIRWKCTEDGKWKIKTGEIDDNKMKELFKKKLGNICEPTKCHRPNVS